MDVQPPEAHIERAVGAVKFHAPPPHAKMDFPTPPRRQSAHVAARLARPTQQARSPAARGAQPHPVPFVSRRIRRIRPTPFPRSAASRSAPPAPASRAQVPGLEQSVALRSPNSTPRPLAGQAAPRSTHPAAAPVSTLRSLLCRSAAACCARVPKGAALPACCTRTKIPNPRAALVPPNVYSAPPSAGRPDTRRVVRSLDPRKSADLSASHRNNFLAPKC